MFERYVIQVDARTPAPRTAGWVSALRRLQLDSYEIRPGDMAPVLVGDPADGLPLELGTMMWGVINPWSGTGAMYFMPLNEGTLLTAAHKQRCLVPVTALVVSEESIVHDPDQPLLTLAGLIADAGTDGARGMCFLTTAVKEGARSYAAPLVVAPQHHEEWLDSWGSLGQVRSCGQALVMSRLSERGNVRS
jgi:putative SOS response-associated peptidase YedK